MSDVNSRPADTLVMDVSWDEEGGEADCVEGRGVPEAPWEEGLSWAPKRS